MPFSCRPPLETLAIQTGVLCTKSNLIAKCYTPIHPPQILPKHTRAYTLFEGKFPFSHGLGLILFLGVFIQVFHQVGDIVVIIIGFIGTLGLILLELFSELAKSLEGVGAELI
jgi:hypothetical protein